MQTDSRTDRDQPAHRTDGTNPAPGTHFRTLWNQRAAFVIVGAFNTAFGIACFAVFLWLLRDAIGYMGALLCTHVVAMLCAFVLNRKFVFRVTGHLLRDLWRFELVNLSVLGFNAAALPALVEMAELPVLLAQIVVVATTTAYRWIAHRRFTFHRAGPR